MDLSKLPRLSGSDRGDPAPPVPVANPAPASEPLSPAGQSPDELAYHAARGAQPDASMGVIWFNTIVGLFCLYLSRSFPAYVIARVLGHPFHSGVFWDGDPTREVPYPQVEGYAMFSDAGLFFFGIAVLLEAMLKALWISGKTPPRWALQIGVAIATLCTLWNIYVCILVLGKGGLPLTSGLAVAFGGWITLDLLALLRWSHSRTKVTRMDAPAQ